MNLWNYSPDDVSVLLAGVYPVEGLVEGTFVEIVKDVQPYKTKRCADGEVGRSKTNNSTYTVTITLMSGSPTNDVFTKLWLLDAATGSAQFPLLIKDSLGTGYFFSGAVWVEGIPNLSFATEATERQWTLRCNQGVLNVGGNEPSGTLERLITIASSGIPLIEAILEGGI